MKFLASTGACFGEATALKSTGFSYDEKTGLGTVRIERAWKEDGKKGWIVGPPKTQKTCRTVVLSPEMVDEFRPHAKEAGSSLVFTNPHGGFISHDSFYGAWRRAWAKLGYRFINSGRPRVHDLRHTHASMMLERDMSITELLRRLGHESIQTTIDRYSHLTPDAHYRARDIASAASIEW